MILILSNFTILLTTTCRIIKIITENTTYVSCRKYAGAPHFKQKDMVLNLTLHFLAMLRMYIQDILLSKH